MAIIPFKGGMFALSPTLIEEFRPFSEVVVCHIFYKDKFLLLKRVSLAPEGDKWSMPGGKVEAEETLTQAMIREAREETGILIEEEKMDFLKTFYVRRSPKQDLILHLFKTEVPSDALIDGAITLNKEHTAYIWVNWVEAYRLNLLSGGATMLHYIEHSPCLTFYYR